MRTKTRVKLQFRDEKGSTRIISIDRPKEGLTNEEVKKAMDEIIAAKALGTKNGNLVAKVKAVKETVESHDFDVR